MSWRVERHHATHAHPYLSPTPGNGIPITAPAPEDIGSTTNSYLEIYLTATDFDGRTTTVQRNMDPRLVDLSFADWQRMMAIHLNGAFLTTRACLRHMYAAKSGSVLEVVCSTQP